MGAILDLVEKMQSPMGIVVTIGIVIAGYFFYKWVTAEPPALQKQREQQEKQQK